jgi:hypothetical protein
MTAHHEDDLEPDLPAAWPSEIEPDANEADALEQALPASSEPVAVEDDYPHSDSADSDWAARVRHFDPYLTIVERLCAEFEETATVSTVIAMIESCRAELDVPSTAALPELVERLARQRLSVLPSEWS